MNDAQPNPYSTLGNHLKYLREQHRESLAEVSGAVEIDETVLERIEAGRERPAEDILLLLINHFDMQDQEAVQLWELAGYDSETNDRAKLDDLLQDAASDHKPVIVVLGIDGRTMYTDAVQISQDKAGIVMNFGQMNSKKQQQSVARLGMSYEQAADVLRKLQHALLRGQYEQGPKRLPPANNS